MRAIMNMDFEIIKNFGSTKEVALTQHKMIRSKNVNIMYDLRGRCYF